MNVHQHSTYVQWIGAVELAPIGFFAVCMNCYWQGPDRPTKAEAARDGDDHAATTAIEARLI